jgi:hemerythrin superfamily protein
MNNIKTEIAYNRLVWFVLDYNYYQCFYLMILIGEIDYDGDRLLGNKENVRGSDAREVVALSRKLNFDEPIPDLVERLKKEHRQFELKLAKLETIATIDKQSVGILEELSEPIMRHAVEEEAIIMRVIVHKAREQATESIKIAQEHNWVMDFFKQKLPQLTTTMTQQQAKQELTQFIQNLRSHFSEEEETMFPLALKANSVKEV